MWKGHCMFLIKIPEKSFVVTRFSETQWSNCYFNTVLYIEQTICDWNRCLDSSLACTMMPLVYLSDFSLNKHRSHTRMFERNHVVYFVLLLWQLFLSNNFVFFSQFQFVFLFTNSNNKKNLSQNLCVCYIFHNWIEECERKGNNKLEHNLKLWIKDEKLPNTNRIN